MNSGIPRQAQDERQRAWEIAQEAARRSGMSVDQWLDTVLIEDSPPRPPPDPRNPKDDERHRRVPHEDLSGVKNRLDTLGRQLEELAGANAAKAQQAAAPSPSPATPLDQAVFEIAERQQALDGAALSRADLPRAQTQPRQITDRVETMRPCAIDNAVETLRKDLAEIGRMLKEAMPRRAVEALETEVRALAARIDTQRHAGIDEKAIASLEHGLAEMRDALRGLTPAESLVGLDEAVKGLTQRIDRIAGNYQDPAAREQLESTIVGLRAIVSHVASNEALAKLSDEVRRLADKVDHIAGSDVLSMLEQRIAATADALQSRHQQNGQEARDLDAVVSGLTDKIEQLQLTRADHAAAVHLEDRIAKLVEKLDASDAHLSHLEAIERGLAELLIHTEHQRPPSALRGSAPAPAFDTIKSDVQRNQDSLEQVNSTLGHVVDRLAKIETGFRGGLPQTANIPIVATSAPAAKPPATAVPAAEPAAAVAMPSPPDPAPAPASMTVVSGNPAPATERDLRPIDPDLPPDHPLEPGSSVARGRHGTSPAERIAASEAMLGSAKPPVIPDPAGKSDFIAAARRAALAASSEAVTPVEKRATGPEKSDAAPSKIGERLSKRVRSLLVGASVLLLVLGSLQIAANLFFASNDSDGGVPDPAGQSTPDISIPTETIPKTLPAAPAAGRQSMLVPGANTLPPLTPLPGGVMSPGEPTRQATSTATAEKRGSTVPADGLVTGSIPPPANALPEIAPLTPRTRPPGAERPAADKLPAAIGSVGLRAAAVKGDPTAEFEIALRFAEGRGVPQDLTAASEWFERAAKRGLVPAQFRLGGLYEKGLGVKKNIENARRLYLAAAEAGNAKAMHNLAVLYAEGMEDKPDYQSAAKWFRKAAHYGIADSQYNLGILYARGIGVEVNMVEAYKWFSLAAREGDKDAAKKRDDVGSRLDQQSLMTARAAAQVWTAEAQPATAIHVKVPAGGWDAVAAPAVPKRRVGSTAEMTPPRSAQ